MKILFAKIWNTLKRDGIAGAIKSTWLVLRPIQKGDVLIITGGIGDSARYRAFNVAEELNLHGIKTQVAIQNSPFLVGASNNFKIFIFHRIFVDKKIGNFIQKIKAQKKEIIFETDDLLFDPRYIINSDYFKNINSFEKKLYEKGLGTEILDDPYVEACTTTTSFLADRLREKNKIVFVVPNKLSCHDLEITDRILKKLEPKKQASLKIGYFSGTISHNKDFAAVTDALMDILEKYPQVKLVLAGPLEVGNKLAKFKSRIEKLPFVPRDKHFENVASVDINIAPLEINNPFCESKSELKFFGAGVLKVPTVAIRNQTFSEAITDGTDGFLASNTQEWIGKISRLIEDADLRRTMGEKARKKALDKYSNKNSNNEEYYNYLRSKINRWNSQSLS